MNLKLEEDHKSEQIKTQMNPKDENSPENGYEIALRRLEEEIRNHVRVEQQLKIQLENMSFAKDELDHIKQKLSNFEKSHKDVFRISLPQKASTKIIRFCKIKRA